MSLPKICQQRKFNKMQKYHPWCRSCIGAVFAHIATRAANGLTKRSLRVFPGGRRSLRVFSGGRLRSLPSFAESETRS